jgi:membrane-associated phospholipid phosphatase
VLAQGLPKVSRKSRWLYFSLVYAYVVVLYVLSNHQNWFEHHTLPLTGLDTGIPFLPWTGWAYIMVYFFPLFSATMMERPRDIRAAIVGFIFVTTLSFGIFLMYPTVYPRPALAAPVGFWETFLNGPLLLVRMVDTPANSFPSLHVAMAFLAAFFIRRQKKIFGTVSILTAILIALSTLTTKQHYVWDVVGGYALARITFAISELVLD